MPLYRFRALNASGLVFEGEIEKTNEAALRQSLKTQGAELITARQPAFSFFRRKPPQAQTSLAEICRFLHDLLCSGLSFPEALHLCRQPLGSSALGLALSQAEQALRQGSSLAEAFASPLFKPTFRAALAAGEGAGDLATCFARLAEECEAEDAFRRKLTKAARYPIFLLCVACGVTCFMLTLVVPSIVQFLKSFDQELPMSTRCLIALADAAPVLFLLLFGMLMAAGLAGLLLPRFSVRAAQKIDHIILHLPVLGILFQNVALLRFLRALNLLLQSGVHLPEAMATAAPLLNRPSLVEKVERTRQALLSGASLSQAALFLPPFALAMISVGENAGRLSKALTDIIAHMQGDLDARIDRTLAGIEPCLTLAVGGLLAWIVLAVLGPLYSNIGALGMGR